MVKDVVAAALFPVVKLFPWGRRIFAGLEGISYWISDWETLLPEIDRRLDGCEVTLSQPYAEFGATFTVRVELGEHGYTLSWIRPATPATLAGELAAVLPEGAEVTGAANGRGEPYASSPRHLRAQAISAMRALVEGPGAHPGPRALLLFSIPRRDPA